MLNKLKKLLITVVVCLFACQSAQVNISGRTYVYNNEHIPHPNNGTPCRWHQQQNGVGVILTAQELHDHLVNIKNGHGINGAGVPIVQVDILKELARMLLAQISPYQLPGAAGVVKHNDVANNTPGYVLVAVARDDIYRNCDELKEHMLFHGHLGYYPCLSFTPGRSPCAVNQLSARGIFNIPFNVANRITNFQKNMINSFLNNNPNYFALPHTPAYPNGYNINADTFHLLPTIASEMMFNIDPWVSANLHPNLADVANGLINALLSNQVLNPANGANAITIGGVNKEGDRFNLTVTYNFQAAIPNVTQTKCVGFNRSGKTTNRVTFVIQVDRGKLSIVTMYPEG